MIIFLLYPLPHFPANKNKGDARLNFEMYLKALPLPQNKQTLVVNNYISQKRKMSSSNDGITVKWVCECGMIK